MPHRFLGRRLKPYGPRGVAMLALALLAFGRAAAYILPPAPSFAPAILVEISDIIPTVTWGVLWAATGVYLVFSAYRKTHVRALAAMGGMSVAWALVYVYAAVTRTMDSGWPDSVGSWITATAYAAIVVLVGALAAMINVVEAADEQ